MRGAGMLEPYGEWFSGIGRQEEQKRYEETKE